MTIETINKRIENGKAKLAKLEAKMSRIKKAEASGWESNNPYFYSESDIKYTQRDIDEQKASIENYEKMLQEETDKANSRNVPVLVEFLNRWKENATNWYNERRTGEDRKKAKKAVETTSKKKQAYESEMWTARSELCKKIAAKIGASREHAPEVLDHPEVLRLKATQEARLNKLKKAHEEAWNYYEENYGDIDDIELGAFSTLRMAKLEKIEAKCKKDHVKFRPWDYDIKITKAQRDKAFAESIEKILDKEWNRKYDKLLEAVIRITGTIDDASELRVNEKGDLDGYITGKKGTAKINTFGAGGYNIQCFHYRTKITKVKL